MIQFFKKIAVSFFLLLLVAAVHAEDMYIVLMAGQSNMAGRGLTRPQDTITYSNIYSLNKDSVWVVAKNPVHWDKTAAGVGMGITFAHELSNKIGKKVKIGLVPCAAGGTSVDEWLSNAWFPFASINLYSNLINRARKAAKSGKIIGMIWHQGESDANSRKYEAYQKKLETLFLRIRKDLNLPNMPIVAGELGLFKPADGPSFKDSINASIHRLKATLPYYDVAKSESLTPNSDNIHFTSESQTIFGGRYAELFYPLAFGKKKAK
ncbi:MAG: sialate O-acetylesterase [Bacteroidales bacterium]|nr:sialate O-acetylesterase [Bacteroidales bacterium]